MTAWFSKKPRLTPRSQFPPEIVRAIHTMADDMAGTPKPENVPSEPLVAFQPGQNGEAAFYAAPEIRGSESVASSPAGASVETSPFLSDAPLPPVEEEAIVPQNTDSIAFPTPPSTREELAAAFLPNQEESTEISINSLEENTSLGESSSLQGGWAQYKKWVFLGLGIVVFLILLGGAWYWWQSRPKVTVPTTSTGVVKETPPTIDITVKEEKPTVTHYSATQPNLLSFDTETVTADSMTTEFLKIALAIKEDNLRQPVEFLIRDQNYNPLAFSRFVYLLNLNLPTDFLSTLDENFSLFFYLDQDRPRIGLKVAIKDKEAFTTALKKGEITLPRTLEPLFLDKTTAPKTGLTFRSSLYQEQPIRYANVDETMNLSIDYAVRENNWFIGTSQKTLRALLDQMVRP